MQFEWIIWIIYGNERASNAIQKVEIANIKGLCTRLNERIYYRNEFDDQLLLYRQYCAHISNSSNTKTILDFSRNKKVQQAKERRDFFTNRSLEKLYIDMKETLGYTGNKDEKGRLDHYSKDNTQKHSR